MTELHPDTGYPMNEAPKSQRIEERDVYPSLYSALGASTLREASVDDQGQRTQEGGENE